MTDNLRRPQRQTRGERPDLQLSDEELLVLPARRFGGIPLSGGVGQFRHEDKGYKREDADCCCCWVETLLVATTSKEVKQPRF